MEDKGFVIDNSRQEHLCVGIDSLEVFCRLGALRHSFHKGVSHWVGLWHQRPRDILEEKRERAYRPSSFPHLLQVLRGPPRFPWESCLIFGAI